MQVRSLGQEDPLEKIMATHSSILAWKFQYTEEPGGLQSIRLRKSWIPLSTYTQIPVTVLGSVNKKSSSGDGVVDKGEKT